MKKNKRLSKELRLVIFNFIPLAFFLFVCSFFFLVYPQETAKSVSQGIELCVSTVVPSLFPFMVLSQIFVSGAFCEKLSEKLGKLTSFLFSLSPLGFSVVLISFVGGYPTGAIVARKLFEDGKISKHDFRHLLLFAVNPSPAFAIGAVGSAMLFSKEVGIIIFSSVVLSSLVLGVFSKIVKTGGESGDSFSPKSVTVLKPFSRCVVESITESGKSILFISFSILFFSAVLSIFDRLFPSKELSMFFGALLEVTCGCKRCFESYPAEIIAGIIGWGGLCTHFQIMREVILSGLQRSVFFVFRLLHGALSAVICSFLLKLFKSAVPVFSSRVEAVAPSSGSCLAFSFCLIGMCIILMLGNNNIISGSSAKAKKSDIEVEL